MEKGFDTTGQKHVSLGTKNLQESSEIWRIKLKRQIIQHNQFHENNK